MGWRVTRSIESRGGGIAWSSMYCTIDQRCASVKR
jgi:hypothetical protein